MNEKEVSEIRRRFRPEKSNITHIRGCYVNENREIVAQFDQPLALMSQEEAEKFLAILKRTLSGTLGKNLIDIRFATRQVAEGEEHRLLMQLRETRLKEQGPVQTFFEKVIGALELEGNYLILLAHDTYDVPFRSRDGERQEEASSQQFAYLLCSICPVKLAKPALSYQVQANEFHSRAADWLVAPPELGFLFPAFEGGGANLYHALYYSKDAGESHKELVEAVFRSEIPMPAQAQKEAFQSVLGEALDEECRLEVVQAVQEQLCAQIEAHKESREEEPLVISKGTVECVLKSCGISDSHVSAFDQKYDGTFGAGTQLSPRNLVDTKRIEIKLPDVVIQVSPERGDLIETRLIEGKKYVLIRADEGVEVNGIGIHITE